jgi:hypothetical protein
MKATGWGFCAMTVLTGALMGCPGSDIFTQSQPPPMQHVQDELVDAKLEVSADQTIAVMRQLGLQTSATQDSEGVRIVGTTALGKHVAVVLSHCPVNDSLTVVHQEWEDEADNDIPGQIVVGLEHAGLKVLVKS